MFISVPDSTGVLIRKDHNKWRGSQQIGSPEPGNEKELLSKANFFQSQHPHDNPARVRHGNKIGRQVLRDPAATRCIGITVL